MYTRLPYDRTTIILTPPTRNCGSWPACIRSSLRPSICLGSMTAWGDILCHYASKSIAYCNQQPTYRSPCILVPGLDYHFTYLSLLNHTRLITHLFKGNTKYGLLPSISSTYLISPSGEIFHYLCITEAYRKVSLRPWINRATWLNYTFISYDVVVASGSRNGNSEEFFCEKRNASTPLGIEPRTFRLPGECPIIWASEVPQLFSQNLFTLYRATSIPWTIY